MSAAPDAPTRAWRLWYVDGPRWMSRFRKLLVTTTHKHCTVEFQGPVQIGPGFHLWIPNRGTLIVGPHVQFRRGFTCEIAEQGRVSIGAGTVFTSSALIQCTTSIDIGQRCAFGQSVLIVDGYHRYLGQDTHWLDQGYDYKPITIGDGAGVSDKCTIQDSIGERSMIASQSVVNRPIPAWSLAAGSPARVVRYFGPDDQRPSQPARPAAGGEEPVAP